MTIGLDLGRHRCVASDGERSWPVTPDRSGLEALIAHGPVTLEPSGPTGVAVARWLLAAGVDVRVVQPGTAHRARAVFAGPNRKSDPVDALVLARLASAGVGRALASPAEPFASLRALTVRRAQVDRERERARSRIDAWAALAFPELAAHVGASQAGLRWLLGVAPTPSDVVRIAPDELVAGARSATKGRWGASFIDELRQLAQVSIGAPASPAERLVLRQLLSDWDHTEAALVDVDAALAGRAREVSYVARWLTVPGLGLRTAAILLGELGDVTRFPTAAPLLALAGLDWTWRASGATVGRPTPSYRGRAYARRWLYLAALRLGSGALAPVRERQRRAGLVASKAAVANMRRLLKLLFALARDDRDFDLGRLG